MHQNRWRLGLRPRPHWGSLQRSPRPPSWIQGVLLLRRGEGGEGKWEQSREGRARGFASSWNYLWLRPCKRDPTRPDPTRPRFYDAVLCPDGIRLDPTFKSSETDFCKKNTKEMLLFITYCFSSGSFSTQWWWSVILLSKRAEIFCDCRPNGKIKFLFLNRSTETKDTAYCS